MLYRLEGPEALRRREAGLVGYRIANDGVSLALARELFTVIAIVGTGSVVMAKVSEREVEQLGGQGWVASDYGSGFWIGRSGIRAAYRTFENGSQTSLTSRLVSHYQKLTDRSEETGLALPKLARHLGILGHDLKHQVASFATEVCALAQRGDAESQAIVRQAAAEVADDVARMYRRVVSLAGDKGVIVPKVLLCGSVADLSPFFQRAFSNRLNLNLSGVIEDLGINTVDIDVVPSGINDSVELARRLAEEGAGAFPRLGPLHPISIYER